jgi:exonuclease SbcC
VKINKLQVGNFGKFKDYELNLKDGFQIIYGKNEDGKSTLMAFIKMMFYSKLERGRDIDKNMRKKYQPWDGSMMNGAVEFECGGISYRLQKDIGPTPSSDRVKLINTSNGELIPLGKNEEVGKRFFGFDLAGFERSVFISQIGNFSANSNDEVAEKLMSNLVLSGDENISQQLIVNRLNDAIEDMESKNRKKGLMVDAKNELDSLHYERFEIQIQEDEQKQNMEEYYRLKAKLDEQKNIQKLLKCNTDKNKFQQLTSLIDKIINYTELEKTLEKEHFPYKSLEMFLTDCNALMEETEKTKGSLEKLKGSVEGKTKDGDKLTPISEEEYRYLNQLTDQEKKHKDLLKRIDESFIPAFNSFIKAKNDYHHAGVMLKQETDIVEKLQKFHEDFQKCEEEETVKIKGKEDLINKFERDKVQWNTGKQLREQRIKFAGEKESIQSAVSETGSKKSQMRNALLILSGIVGVVSIMLAFVISLWAAIGLGFAAILGIFAVRSGKQSQTEPSFNAGQELQNLKIDNEKEEERIYNETAEYKKKITSISNQIYRIEEELKSLSEKNNSHQNASNACPELKNKKDMSFGLMKMRQEAYQQEKNYLLREYSEKSGIVDDVRITALQSEDLEEADALDYRNRLGKLNSIIEVKIQEQLKAKSCSTAKEYESKFLEYASDLKNQNTISEAEQEYRKKTEEFLNKVNIYEITGSYEEAKELIQKLGNKVSELEKEKDEALHIAKGMGYDAPSLDYLKEETGKLVPSIEFLKETGGTLYTAEELQQRQRELAGENTEQRFFDLQKKIRTPDKNLSQIEEEIDEKGKEVKEKTSYFKSLKIASEVMQEASDEMRQSFGPELNRSTAAIFENLTNGKYGNILVNKDYDISVQSGIHYREWKYLSNGTIDQAYLALRLAITELISDKNIELPLFLDDVLIQYDDERLEAALNFLADYAKQKGQEFQLLLFTCHQHIIDYAKPYAKEIVNI